MHMWRQMSVLEDSLHCFYFVFLRLDPSLNWEVAFLTKLAVDQAPGITCVASASPGAGAAPWIPLALNVGTGVLT